MSPWLVFWITYFVIYLFIAWKQETINVFAFFIGYPLLRIPIAATFAILYWMAVPEVVAQVQTPGVELSDIMIDDLKEPGLVFEPVYILPSED